MKSATAMLYRAGDEWCYELHVEGMLVAFGRYRHEVSARNALEGDERLHGVYEQLTERRF
jgi:hypothetical protein